jgi:hypothetical protein
MSFLSGALTATDLSFAGNFPIVGSEDLNPGVAVLLFPRTIKQLSGRTLRPEIGGTLISRSSRR